MDNLGVLLSVGAVVVLGASVVYLVRYQVYLREVTETLVAAEDHLDRGEVEPARALVAPLLSRHPTLAVVQEVAADILYAGGDPLSAASLWERAMKELGAERVAPRLVAAYTALNRPGDARRVAKLVPDDALARVTLAWCEIAAIGGDRERGRALADEVARDERVRGTTSGDAIASALTAVAAAQAADTARMRDALEHARLRAELLAPHDRAFIGYLRGIALRDAGLADEARATWTEAYDGSPESIGGALARRERSHLPEETVPGGGR